VDDRARSLLREVFPGIHWIKNPIGLDGSSLSHVNTYLVSGKDGYLLVDTGWNTEESFNEIRKSLEEIGASIKDISQILVTHVHPDHYGMAGRIKKLSGARIYLHEIENAVIDARYVNMEALLGQTAEWLSRNGVPAKETGDIRDASLGIVDLVVPAKPDILLHGGEIITTGEFTFHVIWTPGHSPGHVCLYEPEKKVLLSGDHILPTITPNIGRHPQSAENPLRTYLESLYEIRQMDISLVLPGHDEPFTGLVSRIDEIVRHHEQRNLEILAAVSKQPRTAFDVAEYVTWGTQASWRDLPPIHRRMAIFETIAHLEFMIDKGRAMKIDRDNVIYYRQT
jgi:glyoxylase-like metal-dependent hydrolase (beta-lactamase superfamily II)